MSEKTEPTQEYQNGSVETIRLRDCVLFQFGNRRAIEALARCPKALILLSIIGIAIPAQIRLSRLYGFKDLVQAETHGEAVTYANQYDEEHFPVTRKIYPPYRYHGFGDATKLFSELKGTEKAWLRRDIETWLTRGMKSRRLPKGMVDFLEICPVTDYHRNVLEPYRDVISEELTNGEYQRSQAIDDWLTALDINLEKERPPGDKTHTKEATK